MRTPKLFICSSVRDTMGAGTSVSSFDDAVSVRRQWGLGREGTKEMIRVWCNRGYIEAKVSTEANSGPNEQLNSFSKHRQGYAGLHPRGP